MSLPPIVAKITADTSELSKGLGDASARLKTFAKVGAAAATAVGVAIVALTKTSMANIDANVKQARSLGLTNDAFQRMALVANEAGVETGRLSSMLGLMQRNIDELASGTQTQVDAFARLGLSIQNLQGLSPDEQFARIAEALDQISDPTQKTALAMDVFGRSGRDAINMLEGYRAKTAEATAFQQRFGIAVTQDGAEKVERANDAVGRLGMVMEGLGNTIAVKVAPVVERLANKVIDLTVALFNLRTEAEQMQDRVAESFDDVLGSASDAAQSLDDYAMALDAAMQIGAAEVVRRLAAEMDAVRVKFDEGKISGQQMAEQMEAIRLRAVAIVADLKDVNSIGFDAAIERLGTLGTAIANAAARARELAISGGVASFPGKQKDDLATFTAPPDQPDIAPGIPSGGAVRDQLAERLEALIEGLQTEAEAIAAWYAEGDATLRDALAKRLLTEEEYREQRERLEEEHQKRIAAIREMGNQWGVEAALSGGAEILNAMGQTNKKALKVAQAFAAAEALVSTYKGAAKALEKGAFGFAEAAAVIAKGLSFVAAIRGVKAGGSAPSGAGGGAAASAPAAGGGVSQNVAIQLVGGDMFSRSQVVTLINKINEAVEGGAKLRIV